MGFRGGSKSLVRAWGWVKEELLHKTPIGREQPPWREREKERGLSLEEESRIQGSGWKSGGAAARVQLAEPNAQVFPQHPIILTPCPPALGLSTYSASSRRWRRESPSRSRPLLMPQSSPPPPPPGAHLTALQPRHRQARPVQPRHLFGFTNGRQARFCLRKPATHGRTACRDMKSGGKAIGTAAC